MNWFKKGGVMFSMALNKLEKDTFAQNGAEDILANNAGVINPYVSNQLMQDLKEGRVTQQVKEFRKHHYQILQASNKFKFKNGQLLSEDEVKQSKVTQGDPFDKYEVEIVFDNKAIGRSLYEEGEIRPLKIQRGVVPRHKLENYTSILHIRNIDGKNKLIDFYIPKITENTSLLREIELMKNNPRVTDLVNFTKMSFNTQDSEMLQFEYRMLALDKVVTHGNDYIIKMFAECTVDGIWAAQKYMIID